MADRHEPRSTELDKRIQRLWSTAGKNMWHGMSCRCCGGGMFTMNSSVLELDLLDYLADKYQNEGLAPLSAAINDYTCGQPRGLPAWLLSLEREGTLSDLLLDRLKNDVADLLENMQSGSRF
ncbi:hypothetical protein [Pusillimonas noertemannii]|nr:hypothetical protein [Pusillimonas noertemannii]NYT67233.1 hypothetical protein [Pusillimonas noertemannii]TFL12572.1 hypothetical protein CSC72_05585 [Pusillimonas noertemannii]